VDGGPHDDLLPEDPHLPGPLDQPSASASCPDRRPPRSGSAVGCRLPIAPESRRGGRPGSGPAVCTGGRLQTTPSTLRSALRSDRPTQRSARRCRVGPGHFGARVS
jgi:hypothetical protein